jgi:hypothetical protein
MLLIINEMISKGIEGPLTAPTALTALDRAVKERKRAVSLPYFRIDLKDIPERYKTESLLRVLPTSPRPLRRAVENLARCFHHEFRYRFVPFAADDDQPYTAYLFADPTQSVWVGACCFRTEYFNRRATPVESLHWAWFHPFARRAGLLKNHWEALRAAHGDFYVEHPLSHPMREFLLKHAKGSEWYPIFEGKQSAPLDFAETLAEEFGRPPGGIKS